MPAVAVTDQNNLFALVKFYRAAIARGLQPIVGVDLLVRESGERAQASRVTLLCQSQVGYRNITRLVSRAYVERQASGAPMIDRRWLSAESVAGLIALSCATEGDIGRCIVNGREPEAERALDFWLDLFGDRFYIELQRLGRGDEESYIAGAVALAGRRGVPVVATNDVRFSIALGLQVAQVLRVGVHRQRLAGRRSAARSPRARRAWPGCWSAAASSGCRGRRGSARRCRSRGRRRAGRARGSRRGCRSRRPAAGRPAACAAGRCRGPRGRGCRARRRGPRGRPRPARRRAAARSRSAASRTRRR